MFMIRVDVNGSFDNTINFLKKAKTGKYAIDALNKYAEEGLNRLKEATPKNTGLTADSWEYAIKQYKGGCSITYTNSNVVDGQNIAILLQYGHANKSGGWVEGVDYINPALKPVFKKIANSAWKELNE